MSTSSAVSADPGLLDLMRSDVVAARRHFHSVVGHAFPNLYVAISYRVAHALHVRGHAVPAHLISMLCHVLTGAEIRPSARIGPGLAVVHPTGIVVGSDVEAGNDLSLWGSNTLGATLFPDGREGGSPRLGNHVVVLTHASIIGPVQVGDRVLVAAYALVLEDVPDDRTARGIPATHAPHKDASA